MAFCKFRHFKFVSKISQQLFELIGLKIGELIGDDE